jgi:hypothetical protein
MLKDTKDENFNNIHLSLAPLVKAKDWKTEKEWRLIFANGVLQKEQVYKFVKPKGVLPGAKICPKNQDIIISICESKKIPYFKMRLQTNRFKLEKASVKDKYIYVR